MSTSTPQARTQTRPQLVLQADSEVSINEQKLYTMRHHQSLLKQYQAELIDAIILALKQHAPNADPVSRAIAVNGARSKLREGSSYECALHYAKEILKPTQDNNHA